MSTEIYNSQPSDAPLDVTIRHSRTSATSSPSKHRWDEVQFRIPALERFVRSALCRESFQPNSRHIVRSPARRQEVWAVNSESTGQVP